jgi:hypothetical protein
LVGYFKTIDEARSQLGRQGEASAAEAEEPDDKVGEAVMVGGSAAEGECPDAEALDPEQEQTGEEVEDAVKARERVQVLTSIYSYRLPADLEDLVSRRQSTITQLRHKRLVGNSPLVPLMLG